MSATEELRRMLDERGIGHYDVDINTDVRTTQWENGGKRDVRYEEWSSGTTRLDASNVTPEQAIAATVENERINRLEKLIRAMYLDLLAEMPESLLENRLIQMRELGIEADGV